MTETATEIRLNTAKRLEELDTKFSKAISEVLCSIGELREKQSADLKYLVDAITKIADGREEYEQQTDGYLNGHDLKIQTLEQAMTEVNQSNEKRLTTLESQVKKLFGTKADAPTLSKELKVGKLVNKLQDAITEYNRG